jgi:hypothetical protein
MWIRDKDRIFNDIHRPDRLGVFFSTTQSTDACGPIINAHEIAPHSSANPTAVKAIQHLRRFMTVRIIPGRTPSPPDPTPLRHKGKIVA